MPHLVAKARVIPKLVRAALAAFGATAADGKGIFSTAMAHAQARSASLKSGMGASKYWSRDLPALIVGIRAGRELLGRPEHHRHYIPCLAWNSSW
ncbi:hypothetical protein ACK6D9_03360 [Hoeflea sp. Naph1]|uniref:hypothetical protein n=1 Tax=Hoeflea sp. Naph1 TaxID=3388653 RepID=UPI00398FE01B